MSWISPKRGQRAFLAEKLPEEGAEGFPGGETALRTALRKEEESRNVRGQKCMVAPAQGVGRGRITRGLVSRPQSADSCTGRAGCGTGFSRGVTG